MAAPPEEILPRLAASNAALMARAAALIALGEAASLMDAELRPLRERAHRNLRAAFAAIAERLDEAGLLAVSAEEAAASLYALANETTYLRMTEAAGLSPDAYARWLTDTLSASLLATRTIRFVNHWLTNSTLACLRLSPSRVRWRDGRGSSPCADSA